MTVRQKNRVEKNQSMSYCGVNNHKTKSTAYIINYREGFT